MTINDFAIAILFVFSVLLSMGMVHVLWCLRFLLREFIVANRRIDVIEQVIMLNPETAGMWVRLTEQMARIPVGGEAVEVEDGE